MYLKAINLKGFKSFPDRTRLTFSPGVSVIVGPNGSGKSNITDAVLWALGEQSPSAIRGQSMRDVIFAGGNGQSARRFAEVEVVIDNSEGRAASEFSEISISRRIERNGEGEYRLNGARCRLADIVEALSDTNMGREAHSVISQGRVEEIVSSKPRDRRMLIEEAAGLGKHRKRRHRAQLKLDRTARQPRAGLGRRARGALAAAAAEAPGRGRRADGEAACARRTSCAAADRRRRPARPGGSSWRPPRRTSPRCARSATRSRSASRRCASAAPRSRSGSRPGRRAAAGAASCCPRPGRDRAGARPGGGAGAGRAGAAQRARRAPAAPRGAGRGARGGGGRSRPRSPSSRPSWRSSARDPSEEAARLRRAPRRRSAAPGRGQGGAGAAAERPRRRRAPRFGRRPRLHEMARAEARKASERRAALAGELAAVEAKLAAAAVEGEHEALAGHDRDRLRARAGGLGGARRAAAGVDRRLRRRGRRAARRRRGRRPGADRLRGRPRARCGGEPPKEGARRLLDLVEAAATRRPITERLLADAWLVDELDGLAEGFTRHRGDGRRRVLRRRAPGELRRLPREGTDPALAARSEREELASRLGQREQTEERAKRDLERAEEAPDRGPVARRGVAGGASGRPPRARRGGGGGEPGELARRAPRRAGGGEGPGRDPARQARGRAGCRAAPRRGRRARPARSALRDRATLERRIALESETLPALGRAREALLPSGERLERHGGALAEAEDEDGGDDRRRAAGVLAAGVRAPGRAARGERGDDGRGGRGDPAPRPPRRERRRAAAARHGAGRRSCAAADGAARRGGARGIEAKLARLERRREQIGPVNPLAEREYTEAREHVTELAEQRKDLEKAITELRALIRRTDREIAAAFEETFEATARSFEEMVAELFPGGSGRLRRVDVGPRPVRRARCAGRPRGRSLDEPDEESPRRTRTAGSRSR